MQWGRGLLMAWGGFLLALEALAGMASQPPTDTTIEELQAIATARRARLTTLAFDYAVTQDAPELAAELGSEIRWIDRRILLDLQSGRYQLERVLDHGTDEELRTAVFAFDCELESTLLIEDQVGAVDDHPTFDARREARIFSLMMLNPPQEGGMGVNDGSLESFLEFGRLREEPELVDGCLCWVVDAFFEDVHCATVWLDPERDLLPMKGMSLGRDGTVVSSFAAANVKGHTLPDGTLFWLPETWATEAQIRGHTVRTVVAVAPESVVLNAPLDDANFTIQFPPGTIVTDRVAQVGYVVPEPGEPLITTPLSAFEAVHDPPPDSPATAPPPGAARPAPAAGPAQQTPVLRAAQADQDGPHSLGPGQDHPREPASATETPLSPEGQPTGSPEPAVGPKLGKPTAEPPNDDRSPRPALTTDGVRAVPSLAAIRQMMRTRTAGGWVACVALGVAGAAVGWGVARGKRRYWLPVALGAVAFLGGLAWSRTPPPAVSAVLVEASRRADAQAAEPGLDPAELYCLRDDELVRYIPNPTDEERLWAWRQVRPRDPGHLVHLTILWDGTTRGLGACTIGAGLVPKTLYDVLLYSFKLPPHMFENLGPAWNIRLPGDWVIRPGREPAEYLREIATCVRAAGYGEFAFVPVEREVVEYVAVGTPHAPADVIEVLPHRQDFPVGPVQSGDIERFLREVSFATRERVTNRLDAAPGFQLRWRDNSTMWGDMGSPASAEMVASLFNQIAQELGIAFEPTRTRAIVWQLSGQ